MQLWWKFPWHSVRFRKTVYLLFQFLLCIENIKQDKFKCIASRNWYCIREEWMKRTGLGCNLLHLYFTSPPSNSGQCTFVKNSSWQSYEIDGGATVTDPRWTLEISWLSGELNPALPDHIHHTNDCTQLSLLKFQPFNFRSFKTLMAQSYRPSHIFMKELCSAFIKSPAMAQISCYCQLFRNHLCKAGILSPQRLRQIQ